MNYYNENDRKTAAWLRELIAAGHIPRGDVDERSITEVRPHELTGYTQCHFFAGIGGWPLALRLAGWPDDKPVWTGSCPCQPFSDAGKGNGVADERHLWPAFYKLIAARNPAIIYGEQVASAAVVGSSAKPSKRNAGKPPEEVWLDGVFADLEASHYACGAGDIPAAGVGAPHIRQRLFWVAYAADIRRAQHERESRGWEFKGPPDAAGGRGGAEGLGHAESGGCGKCGDASQSGSGGHLERTGGPGSVGVADTEGVDGRGEQQEGRTRSGRGGLAGSGPWSDFDIIPCRDGKARRVEAGTFPLAHGISGRVGLLRGYGNAIVPQVAAEFILAAESSLTDLAP